MRREVPECILCSKNSYNTEKIEVHYWKVHRDSFKWSECKIDRGRYACGKVREEESKEHIKRHNTMYSKEGSRYYMEPEKLEALFNTEHLDVVQAMLVGLMASRLSTIERGSFAEEILGCRQRLFVNYLYNRVGLRLEASLYLKGVVFWSNCHNNFGKSEKMKVDDFSFQNTPFTPIGLYFLDSFF